MKLYSLPLILAISGLLVASLVAGSPLSSATVSSTTQKVHSASTRLGSSHATISIQPTTKPTSPPTTPTPSHSLRLDSLQVFINTVTISANYRKQDNITANSTIWAEVFIYQHRQPFLLYTANTPQNASIQLSDNGTAIIGLLTPTWRGPFTSGQMLEIAIYKEANPSITTLIFQENLVDYFHKKITPTITGSSIVAFKENVSLQEADCEAEVEFHFGYTKL